MADEAIPVEGTRESVFLRRYTIANNPTIAKYSLLQLSGDNTASFAASGSGAFFAGILVYEKEGGDGETEVTADTGGVWDLTASGVIPRGQYVIMAGGNKVQTINNTTAANAASGGLVVGLAMETASDGEIIRVDLNRGI